MKWPHNQRNAYQSKHLIGTLLTVSESYSIIIMVLVMMVYRQTWRRSSWALSSWSRGRVGEEGEEEEEKKEEGGWDGPSMSFWNFNTLYLQVWYRWFIWQINFSASVHFFSLIYSQIITSFSLKNVLSTFFLYYHEDLFWVSISISVTLKENGSFWISKFMGLRCSMSKSVSLG